MGGAINMSNNIMTEIKEFKKMVSAGGITFENYKTKSKKIKKAIDLVFDEKLKVVRFLLFMHKIEMNQYLDLKMRIDRSRLYYKRLLSSC